VARKELNFLVTEDNRDKGSRFVIKEMPAWQAEEWATRALLALAKSGVELPGDVSSMGLEAIAALGFRMLADLRWEELKPLLDEMMTCVFWQGDAAHPDILRPLMQDDVQEVATRLKLRKMVFDLHTDFFKNAGG
jgi:hypothetical protein